MVLNGQMLLSGSLALADEVAASFPDIYDRLFLVVISIETRLFVVATFVRFLAILLSTDHFIIYYEWPALDRRGFLPNGFQRFLWVTLRLPCCHSPQSHARLANPVPERWNKYLLLTFFEISRMTGDFMFFRKFRMQTLISAKISSGSACLS
jgi:hypothetical protein